MDLLTKEALRDSHQKNNTARQLERVVRNRRRQGRRKKQNPNDFVLHVQAEWYRIPRLKLLGYIVWGEKIIVHPISGHWSEIPMEIIKFPLQCFALLLGSYLRILTCPEMKSR